MNLYWPGRVWRSRRLAERRRRRRWAAAERAAKSALLLSHGGCLDGVASAIVTLRALGQGQVGIAFVQPGDMAHALDFFAGHPAAGRRLLVADLSLQRDQFDAIVSACRRLRDNGWRIEWRDHHHKQWEGLRLDRLRKLLDALEVNDDATESGASLQQKALAKKDPFARRLAETVRDRDLWWNRLPESEVLEFALSRMGTRAFMQAYEDATSGSPVVPPAVAAAAQAEREEQAKILARLLGKTRRWGEGERKVGIVYGWLPKNTGLHELIEEGCAVAINVRPNGKLSLRSRKGADVCHRIAQELGGGGHPNASGADLGLRGGRYWWYVLRRGRVPAVGRLAQSALRHLGAGTGTGADAASGAAPGATAGASAGAGARAGRRGTGR